MPDNKENNPSSVGGPAAGASTTSATSNSKPSKPTTMGTKIQDMLYHSASDGLNDVVIGGCSTCGSYQHETVKCDPKDVQSEYMMSGALQTDEDSSTYASATATATPAVKGGQPQSCVPEGQGSGRRRSV
ncbi:hypothetical protein LA080_009804 [Diaporthe eres]|uniref:Uncharacterized protein n=1 Tax=Diaporthe vaccinii TaxID=105482 RepID=A0ABR4EAV9_9PEZI|nr:hypothetical protein LA080_009804 [Diaporthe eres]